MSRKQLGQPALTGLFCLILLSGLAVATPYASAAEQVQSTKQMLAVVREAISVVQKAYVAKLDERVLIDGALQAVLAAASEAPEPLAPPKSTAPDMRTLERQFDSTLAQLRQKSASSSEDELVQIAISGLLKAVPGAVYLSAADGQGGSGSIGVSIAAKDGVFTIKGMPDSPARRAGLEINDEILAIDDQSTSTISLDEVMRRLRGQIGQPVNLVVRRGEMQPLAFKFRENR